MNKFIFNGFVNEMEKIAISTLVHGPIEPGIPNRIAPIKRPLFKIKQEDPNSLYMKAKLSKDATDYFEKRK